MNETQRLSPHFLGATRAWIVLESLISQGAGGSHREAQAQMPLARDNNKGVTPQSMAQKGAGESVESPRVPAQPTGPHIRRVHPGALT